MKPHSTEVAGLRNIPGGDDRFHNNILVDHGFDGYDEAGLPSRMMGNVFLGEAQPSPLDESPVHRPDFDPGIELIEKPDGLYLEITLEGEWAQQAARPLVTTDLLGNAKIPDLPYLEPDHTPYRLDTDYLGNRRKTDGPFPGPFELPEGGQQVLKVWPVDPPH